MRRFLAKAASTGVELLDRVVRGMAFTSCPLFRKRTSRVLPISIPVLTSLPWKRMWMGFCARISFTTISLMTRDEADRNMIMVNALVTKREPRRPIRFSMPREREKNRCTRGKRRSTIRSRLIRAQEINMAARENNRIFGSARGASRKSKMSA